MDCIPYSLYYTYMEARRGSKTMQLGQSKPIEMDEEEENLVRTN